MNNSYILKRGHEKRILKTGKEKHYENQKYLKIERYIFNCIHIILGSLLKFIIK